MDAAQLKNILTLHAQWLVNPASGQSANLHGADLRGAVLCGAVLCGAVLCGADLSGANLHKAYLSGAKFTVELRAALGLRDTAHTANQVPFLSLSPSWHESVQTSTSK